MAASGITNNVNQSWPECLGTFDEESCRFFLRELGQKIVQNYPFSVGMEEVYAQIVDEYGLDGAADVISVLQELLEDEDTVAGIGDDGDIWRSWRYNWRHRNDDPLNPYVPRARGRILGPPSTTRIRLLKSSNFAQRELMRSSHLTDVSQQYSHVFLAAHDSLEIGTNHANPTNSMVRVWGGHSHDFFLGQTPSLNRISRDSSVIGNASENIGQDGTGPILGDQPFLSSHRVNLYISPKQAEHTSLLTAKCSGTNQVLSDLPRRLVPALSRAANSETNLSTPRRKSDIELRTDEVGITVSVQNQEPGAQYTVASGTPPNSKLPPQSPSPAVESKPQPINDVNQKTPISSRLVKVQENRLSLPSELSLSEVEATPCKKRAFHRQVRMIDGALFQPSTRKGKAIENNIKTNESPVKLVGEKATNRLSSQSAQSTNGLRTSWLRNILNRFRKHNGEKQNLHFLNRHSNLADCVMASHSKGNSLIKRHRAATETDKPSNPVLNPSHDTVIFGFDGVNEHNNKPLPLSPANNHWRLPAAETRRFFFDDGFEANIIPLEKPVSAFKEDLDLDSLVSATMAGPQELSPQEKRWAYHSSSPSLNGRSSPSSFATMANGNPYVDTSTISTTELDPPSPLSYYKQEVSSGEWPFRPQYDLSPKSNQEMPQMSATVLPTHSRGRSSPDVRSNLAEDERRGRRPNTPTNTLKTKFGLSPSKKPRTRSRSPVKRLLGMVKSNSTNQIHADGPDPNGAIPSSTNKKKWKEISHKLKHGFLTADLEQLEQEEMMQQYISSNANVDAVRIITPPSTGDRSTFPVSLKSAGQNILWSELEFALIETANTFLKNELEAGRLTRDSVLRVKHQWQAKNRPHVVEFYYDHATQSELIIANLRSVKLYSDYSHDAVMLNSVLHQWKILIRELSFKTLCMPDSIVRQWLHDGRRVLELLGASYECLFKFDKISTLCVSVINSHEKEKAKQRKASHDADKYGVHQRSASDGSQKSSQVHEAALMALRPFNNHEEAPPLPTPTSVGSNIRKLTPQERVLYKSLQNKHQDGSSVKKQSYSSSLPSAKQRA